MQQCNSGWFWKPRDVCWNEILIILSCLRWKGIRKKGLGFMARRRPGESFLGPKGSKLWSSEPRTLAPASSPYVHTWMAFWLYTVCGHVTSSTENINRLSVALFSHTIPAGWNWYVLVRIFIEQQYTSWAMFSIWIRPSLSLYISLLMEMAINLSLQLCYTRLCFKINKIFYNHSFGCLR